MNCVKVYHHIRNWLYNQCVYSANKDGFVVGVSGGVDSALVSTLCSEISDLKLIAVYMPIILKGHSDANLGISSKANEITHVYEHLKFLKYRKNVRLVTIDLTKMHDAWLETMEPYFVFNYELERANAMSRLRMVTLYTIANSENLLVVGTGNKVEDFGVGFFTKYGDGGVDISPIGNLMKSEVKELAKYLGINKEIIDQPPCDGLWADGRTDEQQLGLSYDQIEWAMNVEGVLVDGEEETLGVNQISVLKKYREIHERNKHKTTPIPVCEIPFEYT